MNRRMPHTEVTEVAEEEKGMKGKIVFFFVLSSPSVTSVTSV